MVGVPSSRGCNSCRKAKKRYKPDTQSTQLITPPAETPSNDTTRLTAEFISLTEINDDRFGFEAYGPCFFADIPRRMGSNSALDTTTSAMIAPFQAIYAALCDPKVELESWFWDVAVQDTIITRPYHYEQNLHCFELGAIGDLPVFLRDPERYLYQLKCYYNILSQERLVMKKLYEEAMVATLPTDASAACRMKAIEYASGHAGLLVQAALIGPTLNPFDVLPDYTQDSHEICDDAILLAHQCQTFRPCGASYVPELLKLVWASLGDGYRHGELERLMNEYAEDVQGASYLEEAKIMRKRLDGLGWSNEQRFLGGRDEGLETPPPCLIL
ncbi:hypothetical protein FCOIX_7386 [Fusarium coicis]|nr:hypothetical protein FCOIX_7386 [Fusarium coicis]